MRNTQQKELVLQVVLDSCDHPTVETIYERCREQMPSISLGTVYRNLNGLVESGKVKHIVVGDGADHFDKTTFAHSHFLCRKCNQMTDVMDDELSQVETYVQKITGNKVDVGGILFKGVCKECLEKQN